MITNIRLNCFTELISSQAHFSSLLANFPHLRKVAEEDGESDKTVETLKTLHNILIKWHEESKEKTLPEQMEICRKYTFKYLVELLKFDGAEYSEQLPSDSISAIAVFCTACDMFNDIRTEIIQRVVEFGAPKKYAHLSNRAYIRLSDELVSQYISLVPIYVTHKVVGVTYEAYQDLVKQ